MALLIFRFHVADDFTFTLLTCNFKLLPFREENSSDGI